MKLLLLAITLSTISQFSYSQRSYEVDFGEKGKMNVTLDDNPDNLPKFQVGLSPLCFMAMPDMLFGYDVRPLYRHSGKLWFDARVNASFSKGIEFSIKFDEIRGPIFRTFGAAHYAIFQKDSEKIKSTNVNYNYDNASVVEVYQAKLPRIKRNSLFADLGIGYQNYHSRYHYSDDYNYFGGNVSTTFFQLGPRYQFSQSCQVITEGVKRANYKTGELFLNLIVPVVFKTPIYQLVPDPNDSDAFGTFEEVETGFGDLTYNRLGWRFGYLYNIGVKNSGAGMSFCAEVGKTSSYTNGGDLNYNSSGGMTVVFTWGLTLGTNPWK